MNRTKLLLITGAHGSNKHRPNAKFFRDDVLPFLEENVVRGGMRAALIYEILHFDMIPTAPKSEQEMRTVLAQDGNRGRKNKEAVQAELTKIERLMTKDWRETRDKGQPFMKVSLNWGFEDVVLSINQTKPGQIAHYMEPQSAETAYGFWATEILWKEFVDISQEEREARINALIEYIRKLAEIQVHRDRLVFSLSERLRGEDPERAIIIPRGTAHRGMQVLFSDDKYDLTYKDAGYLLDFTDEAIARSYVDSLSTAELRKYAELELDYLRYWAVHRYSLRQILLKLFGSTVVAEKELEKAARDYALSQKMNS